MEQTLAGIAVGATGKVIGFVKGNQSYRKKLLAMGLIKGTPFQVVRVAPMGDPVEIMVREYSLSLRREEAKTLLVSEEGK